MIAKISKRTKELMLMVWHARALVNLVRQSHLTDWNWFESYKKREAIGPSGKPIPWISYPAISFLSERTSGDMTIFEFGCGNSTLWWANRVQKVVSAEHDLSWYQKISTLVPSNVAIYHHPLVRGGDYCRSFSHLEEKAHIIVIDGRDRVNCAIQSIECLRPDGCIVWDNSDREEYEPGKEFLKGKGFRQLKFIGPIASSIVSCETSVFYRDNNCLKI